MLERVPIQFVDPVPEENWTAIGWIPDFVDKRGDYELLWLPPETFLDFVDPEFGPPEFPFEPTSVEWLEKSAHAGRKFAPLQVWATAKDLDALKRGVVSPPDDIRRHEGRHRAWLAAKLEMEFVPVAVWPERSWTDFKDSLMCMRFRGVVHHGTDIPFERFDPTKIGTRTDEGQMGRGFYFSTDPNISRGDPVHVTARVELRNPLHLALPSWSTSKALLVTDALGIPRDASAQEITDELTDEGFDGIVLDYTPTGYRHQEVLVLDPENIEILSAENSLKASLMSKR